MRDTALDRSRRRTTAARAAGVTLKDVLQKDEPFGLLLQGAGPAGARRALRLGARARRGAARLHDARFGPAAGGRASGRGGTAQIEQRRATSTRTAALPRAMPPRDSSRRALIALDPQTGHVRAMVGGRSFRESRFNRAMQAKRQPGSAFKPFVFAAALEAGYTPASADRATSTIPFSRRRASGCRKTSIPTATSMTLRTALRTSSNRAAVQLLRSVGIPQTVSTAERLTVETPPSVPSLALGAGRSHARVDDLRLRRVRATAASCTKPRTDSSRGRQRGHAPLSRRPATARARSPRSTAFLMATMLADVVNAGTAYRARTRGVRAAGGGKDRHDQRLRRRMVRRLHAVGSSPASGLDSISRGRSSRNGYAGDLAVPVWAHVHEGGDEGREARVARAPEGRRRSSTSAECPASCLRAAVTACEVVSREGD